VTSKKLQQILNSEDPAL